MWYFKLAQTPQIIPSRRYPRVIKELGPHEERKSLTPSGFDPGPLVQIPGGYSHIVWVGCTAGFAKVLPFTGLNFANFVTLSRLKMLNCS